MELTKKDLNQTVWVKKAYTDTNRKWYKVDAKWKTLWRLAVEIARKLQWKDVAYLNEFWDIGSFVVVENAKDVKVTWNKVSDKLYNKHSGFKWHLKQISLWELLIKDPVKVIWFAVRGMLPKNKLRKVRMGRLKLFAESTNKYDNLSPEKLNIND